MERKNNIEKLIAEIPFYKSLTQISFSSTHAVFNQFRPDSRYEYKETSELTLVDLSNGSLRTLVSNKRLYNPSFNKQGNKIFAVEFDKKHNWKLVEFDLDGKELRRLKIKGHRIVEVQYIDDSEIVVLVLNKVGEKSIQLINLHSNKSRTLLPYSRNSIAGLNVDKKSNIFFEAQQNGKINIFKINHNKNISKCSNEKIGAYFPSSDGRTLFYSKQDSSGSTIAKRPIKKCKRIKLKSLIGFNYLGKSPSDNFGEHVLVHLPDQKKMFNKGKNTTKPQDYETFDKRLLIPHSWNFFTGRGFGLSINTDNYLNTMGLSAEVGQNSEEKQLYYGADLSFKKYYPIFSLGAHKTAREVDLFNTSSNLKWDEIDIDLSMTLPLLYSKNLKTLVSAITLGGKTLEVSNYKEIEPEIKRENQEFNNPYVQFTTSFSKDKKLRSIEVPWGISYVGLYENAHNSSDSSLSSYQFYQSIELFTTGLFSFDGLRFTFNSEKQKDDNKSYKFSPIGSKSGDYVFSRGYDYIFVPEYDKYTANYFFPIAYPDWRIWGLAYFKQLKANLFYDYTNIEHKYWKSKIESTGVELEFESKFFRVIPIDFGFRYVHKISSKENVGEFYLGTSITN